MRLQKYLLAVIAVAAFACWYWYHQREDMLSLLGRRFASVTNTQNHVVVIGSGLAGLSSAIEAHHRGARVTVLEKRGQFGGNSGKATSGMCGVNTPGQKLRGIVDSVDDLLADTLSSCKGYGNPHLAETLATGAESAIKWLADLGLNLNDVVAGGGHRNPRIHRLPPRVDGKPAPVGFSIVMALKKVAESRNITFIYNAHVTKLRVSATGCVDGVEYEDLASHATQVLDASSVILATGGFGAGREMLQQYAPHLAHLPTTNGEWATGDGVRLATAVGAELCDMEHVQVHPTGFVDPANPDALSKFLAPEALRGCGGLLVNRRGERFVNELARRDDVSQAISKQTSAVYVLLTEKAVDTFGRAAAEFYRSKGLFRKYESLDEACEQVGFDKHQLTSTLSDYVSSASSGHADTLGKTNYPNADSFAAVESVWVAQITPALHYTMGGVCMSSQAEVLHRTAADSETLRPLCGLYAAGEVTGGLHGANRLVGNSLLECVVFGRIAGQAAASR